MLSKLPEPVLSCLAWCKLQGPRGTLPPPQPLPCAPSSRRTGLGPQMVQAPGHSLHGFTLPPPGGHNPHPEWVLASCYPAQFPTPRTPTRSSGHPVLLNAGSTLEGGWGPKTLCSWSPRGELRPTLVPKTIQPPCPRTPCLSLPTGPALSPLWSARPLTEARARQVATRWASGSPMVAQKGEWESAQARGLGLICPMGARGGQRAGRGRGWGIRWIIMQTVWESVATTGQY